jgi:hypothetical protein
MEHVMSNTSSRDPGPLRPAVQQRSRRPSAHIHALTASLAGLLALAATTGRSHAGGSRADGRDCVIENTAVLLEPKNSDPADDFGDSVAVDGDWIAVGAPAYGSVLAGRVEIFHRADGTWTQHSIVTPSDGGVGGFGTAVVLQGDTLLVGANIAAGAVDESGAAYVFRLVGDRWLEEGKLVAPDGQSGDQFGMEVALDGDLAVVGAYGHDALGSNAGAAYVYARVDSAWGYVQKLVAPDGEAGDWFGVAVAAGGGVIAVGASRDDVEGLPQRGSVNIFEQAPDGWTHAESLVAPDLSARSFGIALQLRSGTLVAGVLPPSGVKPLAYVCERKREGWSSLRLISSAFGFPDGLSGASIALSPDASMMAWISVPLALPILGINVLRRDDGDWTTEQAVLSPGPMSLGGNGVSSAAFDGTSMVAANSNASMDGVPLGRAFVATVPPRDRDFDGRDDACELAVGLAEDCDRDGIIDDAQRPFRFTADSAPPDQFWQYPGPNSQMMILNRFTTTVEDEVLSSISWLRPPFNDAPIASATVVVYSDPNGDGNPVDGGLLSAQPVLLPGNEPQVWVTVAIAPVPLGPAGTPFFVGLVFPENTSFKSFAATEAQIPHRQTSWWAVADAPLVLDMLALHPPRPWEFVTSGGPHTVSVIGLRANLSDCDASGRLDSCEIAEGTLPDRDGDGLPDDCTPPSSAFDLNWDGQVDASDMGTFLGLWGPCARDAPRCSADFNGDGAVDGADLGMLLSAWTT